MKAVGTVIDSNGVPFLQMRSLGSQSTSEKEKEGRKEGRKEIREGIWIGFKVWGPYRICESLFSL
jgi:hypothetical protein